MHATKAAVEEGIGPGGGVALLRASKALQNLEAVGDERIGINIIARAIEEPMRWIAANAGHEGPIVVERVRNMEEEEGFNANGALREPRLGGRDRPDQSGPLGSPERRVDCLAATHDRSGHLDDSRTTSGRGDANRRHGGDMY